MSMRTEMVPRWAAYFLPWQFPDGLAPSASPAERLEIINNTPMSKTRRRGDFSYTNWNYEVVAQAISARGGGKPWDELVEARILRPLGLDRTDVRGAVVEGRFDNLAMPYATVDKGPAERLPHVFNGSKSVVGPSMGGFSW